MKKSLCSLLTVGLFAAALAVVHASSPAADTQTEIDTLKARLATLEAQQAAANQPADLAALKTVPLADAVKAAVASASGKVGKVTLTAKPGGATYSVEVAGNDNSVTTVEVDAVSGKVTGSSTEFGPRRPAVVSARPGMTPGATPARGARGQRPVRASEEDDD